ncbi:MAG: SOS response-associated peptidase, partial [Acidobacteria bacterium]|nr:SOS response-associated peptidase [Acidobacteriota bacterium]
GLRIFRERCRAPRCSNALSDSYNVAPTQAVLLARNAEDGGRELAALHWGLIPTWSKEPKTPYSTINARAETVAEKPAFRNTFRWRRCLIGADGWCEWKKLESTKQPYFIRLKTGDPFAFARLWARWEREGQRIDSCAVIVTDATETLRFIHDRMPVILPPENYDAWMDPELTDPAPLKSYLKPYPSECLEAYPVSTRVNSPKNNRADLIERLP